MRIIALQGKSNVGKTATLKRMIKTIIDNNIFNCSLIKSKADILKKCCSASGDIKCVFLYNGKKIGITTRGDTEQALMRDFSKKFPDCDIVVCAVHTSGKTLSYIKSLDNEAIIHSKWSVEPYDRQMSEKVNLIQSNVLINIVKKI